MEIVNNKIDKFNLRQVILQSPDQLTAGLKLANYTKVKGDFSNIIICGMGGSALPAHILANLDKTKVPIFIHKDYGLSHKADENSLVICISYSGNTEETISGLKDALRKGVKIVGMASGGEIEALCTKNSIPFVKIPSGIQPRYATGYIFSSMVKVLENCELLQKTSMEFGALAEKLKAVNLSQEKEGISLAKKLFKKIPVVYSSSNLKDVARIWKIKFNENAKIPAFYNYFPELNHNEMVGYAGLKKIGTKNFFAIILQDQKDHPRIKERMELTAKLIKKNGANAQIVKVKEGSDLFKIFSALLLGDWVSYHLALLQKIDPTQVQIVEDFKRLLKK